MDKRVLMQSYIENRATISSGMSAKDTVFVRPDKNTAFMIDDNEVYKAKIEDNKIVEFKQLRWKEAKMKNLKELKKVIYEDLKSIENFYDVRVSKTPDDKASYVYDVVLNQLSHITDLEVEESEDYVYVTLLNL